MFGEAKVPDVEAMQRDLSAADASLVGNDALLAAVFSASNDCIKVLDLDGRLIFMSEGGKRVMEVDDFNELKGCPWPSMWSDVDSDSAREAVALARAGGNARFIGVASTAKGNRRYWDVSVTPIRDRNGTPTQLLSISRDITDVTERQSALSESEAKFRAIADTMPQMVWSTRPDGHHDYYNARWYEFTGVPLGSTDGEGWNEIFHADDRETAWARWRHSLSTGEPYEIEYRLRHHSGEYRWTLGRALPIRDEQGRITRWFGTCTDIHAAKRSAEHAALMSHELSHRIKNIFAIVQGLIGLSARRFPEARTFARDLESRVAALGRAHDFARPHSDASKPVIGETTLQALLREILKPYLTEKEDRFIFKGDEVVIDDRSATPLALIFHEFATNAAKYGAFSRPGGQVVIETGCKEGTCTIRWIERNGPALSGAPEKMGFGTRLSTVSIEDHLGGQIKRNWAREGLDVEMTCPEANLRRS